MRIPVLASAMLLALLPGPASATHGGGDPTSITMQVSGGGHPIECHRVQITATSNGAAAEGETVDVAISMSDFDVLRDDFVEFCDPSQGAWPTHGTGTRDCDDDAVFANGSDTSAGCDSGQTGIENPARATEECVTDAAGTCELAVRGGDEGSLLIVAFFDSDGDDHQDPGEPAAEKSQRLDGDGSYIVSVECSPTTDVDPEGSRHEFRCRAVGESGFGVPDRTVFFDVVGGRNAEEVGPSQCGPTDEGGYTPMPAAEDASGGHPAGSMSSACGYTDPTGSGSPEGTDEIVVWVNGRPDPGAVDDPNRADYWDPQTTISVRWGTPLKSGRTVACFPDGGQGEVGSPTDVECSVRNLDGEPIPDVIVSFVEQGPGTFSNGSSSDSCTTGADGSCTVQMVTASNEWGTTTITGSITHDTCGSTVSDCSDDATIHWSDHHFRWETEITMRYSKSRHRFTGALTSDGEMCRAGRTVSIKKVRPGRDRRVTRMLTSQAGIFRSRRFADPRGRFYAFAREFSRGGDACYAARSEQIRMRRR